MRQVHGAEAEDSTTRAVLRQSTVPAAASRVPAEQRRQHQPRRSARHAHTTQGEPVLHRRPVGLCPTRPFPRNILLYGFLLLLVLTVESLIFYPTPTGLYRGRNTKNAR